MLGSNSRPPRPGLALAPRPHDHQLPRRLWGLLSYRPGSETEGSKLIAHGLVRHRYELGRHAAVELPRLLRAGHVVLHPVFIERGSP